MKKLFVVLILVTVAFFTATAAFAEDEIEYGALINYKITLDGIELEDYGKYIVREGDELTMSFSSVNGENINFVDVYYYDMTFSGNDKYIMSIEENTTPALETTITLESAQIGHVETIVVDVGLEGLFADDITEQYEYDAELLGSYKFTWLDGCNTVGTNLDGMKSYSVITADDMVLNPHILAEVKAGTPIVITDTCTDPNYTHNGYIIKMNGMQRETSAERLTLDLCSEASENLFILTVAPKYIPNDIEFDANGDAYYSIPYATYTIKFVN